MKLLSVSATASSKGPVGAAPLDTTEADSTAAATASFADCMAAPAIKTVSAAAAIPVAVAAVAPNLPVAAMAAASPAAKASTKNVGAGAEPMMAAEPPGTVPATRAKPVTPEVPEALAAETTDSASSAGSGLQSIMMALLAAMPGNAKTPATADLSAQSPSENGATVLSAARRVDGLSTPAKEPLAPMMAATSLLTVAVTDASTLSASLPAKADGLLPLPPSSAAIPVPAISGADGIAVAALPWLALPVISPAGTSASVMTPPLPPVVLNAPDAPQQWGAQIEWSLKAGVQEARIEVHPQALGPVDVQLSMVDGGLKVHMSAAHAATRELLQEQLPRLRESLQSSGIVLTQAEVGQGAPRRDAPLPSRSARHRSNADDNSIGEVTAAPVWQRRVGLLDDYA